MIPVIQSGIFSISPYKLMLIVGTIGMFVCLLNRRNMFRLSVFQCVIFTVLLTIVGFSGAKLLYILENMEDTIQNGITFSGVSFFGSVFLIPLLMPLVGKLFRLSPGQTMDICGPCVAIMIGCMRVGCFLSGCCGGWEACLGSVCFKWPTQAIESICDFTILVWLLRFEDLKQKEKSLYPLFMISYSIMRFFIEFLRDTPKDWLFLSHGQWFSVAAIFAGVLWLLIADRRKRAT